jgi:hypothetical protein
MAYNTSNFGSVFVNDNDKASGLIPPHPDHYNLVEINNGVATNLVDSDGNQLVESGSVAIPIPPLPA